MFRLLWADKGRFTLSCCAHAVPLPCRAAKGLECVFPIRFTQCGRVWFTLAMPPPCHPRPCRSSQGHGTGRPSRDGLWATVLRSASSGYHAELRGVSRSCYQTHTNPRCRWPVWNQTPFITAEEKSGSSTLQKRRSLTQFGYFRLSCGLSRKTRHCRSRAGARHGMCELTHGMAGERHGNGMGAACYVWIGLKRYHGKGGLERLRKTTQNLGDLNTVHVPVYELNTSQIEVTSLPAEPTCLVYLL